MSIRICCLVRPVCLAIITLHLGAIVTSAEETAQDKRFLPLEKHLISVHSAEGSDLLEGSNAKQAFIGLAQFYQRQSTTSYCGLASSVMVLNALGVDRPSKDYRQVGSKDISLFTQENILPSSGDGVVSLSKVYRSGMTLAELKDLLGKHAPAVDLVYAEMSSVKKFRRTLSADLKEENQYIIVNYLRPEMGQVGGGHISPVGAYHEKQDKVLVMDTSNYKYPWVWVDTELLWRAMANHKDNESKRTRGYIRVH